MRLKSVDRLYWTTRCGDGTLSAHRAPCRRSPMRTRTSLVVALLLALVLTACGGGGAEAPEPEGSETAAEPTQAPTDGSEEPVERADSADGTLHLGYILPETGPIAYLGPPNIAAVRFAVERINEAGVVLGNEATF